MINRHIPMLKRSAGMEDLSQNAFKEWRKSSPGPLVAARVVPRYLGLIIFVKQKKSGELKMVISH